MLFMIYFNILNLSLKKVNLPEELKLYFILLNTPPDDVYNGTGSKSSLHKAQIESSFWLQLCVLFYAIFLCWS